MLAQDAALLDPLRSRALRFTCFTYLLYLLYFAVAGAVFCLLYLCSRKNTNAGKARVARGSPAHGMLLYLIPLVQQRNFAFCLVQILTPKGGGSAGSLALGMPLYLMPFAVAGAVFWVRFYYNRRLLVAKN
jgi:hypothetical protein